MNDIYESNQKLICACDDLRALRAILLSAEEHGNTTEIIAVARRALDPIINDIQQAIDTIDESLIRMKKEHVQQD